MKIEDRVARVWGMGAAVGPGEGAWRRVLLAAAGGLFALAQPAVAAQPVPVDFTVHETLPTLTQGSIVRGHLEHCAAARVTTIRAGASQPGVSIFNGSKKIDCGSGTTLTLAFRVQTSGCARTDSGVWQVTRGTGLFAGAKGAGTLVGTYTRGIGPGSFCKSDGLNDRYTGRLEY